MSFPAFSIHHPHLVAHLDIWPLETGGEEGEPGGHEGPDLPSTVINLCLALWTWQMFNFFFFLLGCFCGFSTGPTSKSQLPFTCLSYSYFLLGTFKDTFHTDQFCGVFVVPSGDLSELITVFWGISLAHGFIYRPWESGTFFLYSVGL